MDKIKSFIIDLFKGLSYYENPIPRFTGLGLFICSIVLIYYSPGYWKLAFIAFSIFYLIKEFYTKYEFEILKNKFNELQQNRNKEIKNTSNAIKKDVIHTILQFLGKFFNWKGSFRFTILTMYKKNGKEYIKAIYRTAYGSEAGVISGHEAYFTKGRGLPGQAWADAWDKDKLKDLIDRIKIGHISESCLSDSEKLKEYYKTTFNMTDEIYNSLGELKNEIRSYLSIGVVGERNELSYVLSVDSTLPNAFEDFQNLKRVKNQQLILEREEMRGSIKGVQEVDKEKTKSLEGIDNTEDKTLQEMEIPKEILEAIPPKGKALFEELSKPGYSKRGIILEFMKQTGSVKINIDIFVFMLAMVLKLLDDIIQKKYPLEKEVGNGQ